MRTVLITGVTGLVGRRLAEQLVAAPDIQVRGLARQPAKAADLAAVGVEIMAGDVTDPPSLAAACAGCDWVFHCAAFVEEGGDRAAIWAVNVEGTRHILHAAQQAGVQRFIHVSTCAVYGSVQSLDIDETMPIRRRGNLYADSKVEAEEVVQAFATGFSPGVATDSTTDPENRMETVIARPSQVYGPRSYQFTVRPIEAIRSGKMILVDGGKHWCKPVYIDNLVEGLIACARVPAAAGQAFNLTDGVTVPWHTFFGAYARMLDKPRLPSVPYPLAWVAARWFEWQAQRTGKKALITRAALAAIRSRNSFSIEKAHRILGWTPRLDLEAGMARTQAWLAAEGYLSK
ncbi:MAG: NAD-dependent epimerase/dehydratase family protein [Litorilinea sp.]